MREEEEVKKKYLGIDIGSTTFKAVVMTEDGEILKTTYQRTQPVDSGRLACTGRCSGCGNCSMGAVKRTTDDFLTSAGLKAEDLSAIVVTGSQIVEDTRKFIAFDFQVSEVTAWWPATRTASPWPRRLSRLHRWN